MTATRGRPPRVKVDVEESPKKDDASLEREETSAEAKLRHGQELTKLRKNLKYVDGSKYFYLQPFMNAKQKPDNKIIMCRRKNNGSTYRTYIGKASKQKEFLAKIKKEGLLRSA